MKINTKVIKKLNPCEDRFDNYKYYYEHRNFTLIEFLELDQITHSDKLWVILRLIPLETHVVFALDCAFSAYAADSSDYAAADYAAYASYADYAAAYAVAYSADYFVDYYPAGKKQEEEHQIEALIYLIGGE